MADTELSKYDATILAAASAAIGDYLTVYQVSSPTLDLVRAIIECVRTGDRAALRNALAATDAKTRDRLRGLGEPEAPGYPEFPMQLRHRP